MVAVRSSRDLAGTIVVHLTRSWMKKPGILLCLGNRGQIEADGVVQLQTRIEDFRQSLSSY